MKKLIRELKFAHAAEIAAHHAYEGHWRSVSDREEQEYIQKISLDELRHIHTLETILRHFGAKPNKFLDSCGYVVGEVVGLMCFVTGWRLPMWVAGVMEKIGKSSYKKIALHAADLGMKVLTSVLIDMAKNEDEHEAYFKRLRENK